MFFEHTRVFVYGSLRRGQRHHRLLTRARFLGVHHTAARFTMLDLGPYPGVIEGGSSIIVGEVYAIAAETLLRLDRLEDHPRCYRRQRLETPFGDCWIYLYRHSTGRETVVRGGDWAQRAP